MGGTINPYFNVVGNPSEQSLIDDLIVESIQINGMLIYYIPRSFQKFDPLFGEDPLSQFKTVYPIEAFLNNVAGYEGDRELITKFGLELRDKSTFLISRRRFNQVAQNNPALLVGEGKPGPTEVRPMEGDLLFLPMTDDLYEVRYADNISTFYQWGGRYVWKITAEKFEYSSETIQTGIPDIDAVQTNFQNNDSTAKDPLADNLNIDSKAGGIIDFSETNPFGEPG